MAASLSRLWAAAAFAPPAALATSILLLVLHDVVQSGHASAATGMIASIVLGTIVVAYPAMLLLGLPMHAALVRLNQLSVRNYALAGAAGGAALLGLLIVSQSGQVAPPPITSDARQLARWASLFVFNGVLTALLFWLIRRPDRDARPTQAITSP